MQLRVLRLGFLQNRNVGIGVFPEGEKILIGDAGLGGVAGEGVGTGEAEMGERTERGKPSQFQLGTLYPAYIRGQAQLLAHNGSAAAIEFQRFLDHRGIVINFPRDEEFASQLSQSYDLALLAFQKSRQRC